MSVYVDPMRPCMSNSRWRYTSNCHLFADSIEELKEFAAKLGLKPEWFQNHRRLPHFDLTENMRCKAVKLGAQELNLRETAAFMQRDNTA